MRLTLCVFLSLLIYVSSCSFDPAGLGKPAPDAGTDTQVSDSEEDTASDIITDAVSDGDTHDPDGGDGGPECTADDNACLDYYTLNVCTGSGAMEEMHCTYGCDPSVPTCFQLTPSNMVDPSLVLQPGLASWSLSADAQIYSDTGEITINGNQYRVPGLGLDTNSGIYFEIITLRDGTSAGLFVMQSLTINANVTLQGMGSLPLIILTDTTSVAGVIDVSAYPNSCASGNRTCAGPGGFAGGGANSSGAGPGAGGKGKKDYWGDETGGGGAGFLSAGGKGGGGDGGSAGSSYGHDVSEPLIGGSGGGGGGHNTPTSSDSSQSKGGGGGGAVQLSALSFLEVGSTSPELCGILANGQGGMANDSGYDSGGGGGGSGGAILLEAPRIRIYQGAVIAANGGGGAAGRESSSHGTSGLASQDPAPGGSCGSCNTGGAGAAALAVTPQNGNNNESGDGTGGGGGAMGRVVIYDCLEFLSGGIYSPEPRMAGCHLP